MTELETTNTELLQKFTAAVADDLASLPERTIRNWLGHPELLKRDLLALLNDNQLTLLTDETKAVTVDYNSVSALAAQKISLRVVAPTHDFIRPSALSDPRGVAVIETRVMRFPRPVDLETILRLLDFEGSDRPAEPIEFISYLIEHPESFRSQPLIAPRLIERRGSLSGLLYAYTTDAERCLDLLTIVSALNTTCRFLTVKV